MADHGYFTGGGAGCLQACGGRRNLHPCEPQFAGADGHFRTRQRGETRVEIASQLGAKRSMMLAVSAPFHSALMMPAQEKLAKDLRATKFADLQVPLVTNVDADTIRKAMKPAKP